MNNLLKKVPIKLTMKINHDELRPEDDFEQALGLDSEGWSSAVQWIFFSKKSTHLFHAQSTVVFPVRCFLFIMG